MADEEHLALLKQGEAAWNAWRTINPRIYPNLGGAQLDGVDLRGFHLNGAHLEGTNLRKADLAGAHLYRAHLDGADLREADLHGAFLSGALFEGTRLNRALLCGALLLGALFREADLYEKEEREAFLADVHVGVVSIAEEGRGPLTVPVWYAYEPGGEIQIITARASRKGKLLERAGRFSLCAQTETLPYKYVSVEGPIITIGVADFERHRRPLAHRYLGVGLGDRYIERTRDDIGNALFRMRPERWLTVDYAKQYQSR